MMLFHHQNIVLEALYIKIIISKGIGLLDGHRVTDKDTRECVNSLSIRFISKEKELPKTITYE